jgi:hypothetical protein
LLTFGIRNLSIYLQPLLENLCTSQVGAWDPFFETSLPNSEFDLKIEKAFSGIELRLRQTSPNMVQTERYLNGLEENFVNLLVIKGYFSRFLCKG